MSLLSSCNPRVRLALLTPSFVLLLSALVVTSHAQLTEATLKGTVKDASGMLASAPVIATNENTGQVRSTVTDSNGAFVMPELAPGSYSVSVTVAGYKAFEQHGLLLNVGRVTEANIGLVVGHVEERVEVTAEAVQVAVSTEGRLSDTFEKKQISDLPLRQRDVFSLPSLSAGATAIPGAANSTKLTNSPVVTVNGNRYRGNNYVLDGSMDTNPNNTGEPAIVPSLESVEEVQVQTGNFSSEFGRGNASVVNIRTKSGTNEFHGRAWEYSRNTIANARNYFAKTDVPQVYNQFGANLGGPIFKNKTFFFGSYEGTRNAFGQTQSFQVETPEYRNAVFQNFPNSIAAQLLKAHPAPAPLLAPAGSKTKYVGEVDETTPNITGFPVGTALIASAAPILHDYARFDQYLTRVDHSFHDGKDKLYGRWIAESERDQGGISSAKATLGRAIRGYLGPYTGFFGNFNVGHIHIFDEAVNDARFSLQDIRVDAGINNPVVPQISIIGMNAPFGDVPENGTRLKTYELRDTVSMDRRKHVIRFGFEARKIFKGLSIAPPTPGTFTFADMVSFANDAPFQQGLTVNPNTGQPTNFPRYFTLYETGAFVQDDWKVTSRLNVSLGLRHDYFGTVSERHDLLSSIILGTGSNFQQQLANASIGHVSQLYHPQKLNFSPRVGLAYDPLGDGKTSIRAGFGISYQPHHGQSIAGARALPPDAIQGVLQPNFGIGQTIDYGIPVPFNPEFATGLNSHGGVPCSTVPGAHCLRITGFVVNPVIKTQYSESRFLSVEHTIANGWIAEVGYVGTNGVNLERIDDVNRVDGDLLDGHFDGVNPNFGPLLFVTNGVSSTYNAMTAEVRHSFGRSLTFKSNYRWSKWLDTASDTSTGQFLDNSEPGKGAQNINCLRCERARSMFDIPQRFTTSLVWSPTWWKGNGLKGKLASHWELSTLINAQSGRPFSVWNGGTLPGDCFSHPDCVAHPPADYNGDGGGGAVGGGTYDRPNAPLPGTVKSSFNQKDFLTGLFDPNVFGTPALGSDGTLGRNTYRGPHQITVDLALARTIPIRERTQIQFRLEAFNTMNHVNLLLPNVDLSLAPVIDSATGARKLGTNFGKSTQAFDPRILQASARFVF